MSSNGMEVTDAKSAVRAAKDYLQTLMAEEDISELGLEELDYNEGEGVWSVTLGFSRPWDRNALGAMTGGNPRNRSFRTLKVAPDGEVKSIRIRTI